MATVIRCTRRQKVQQSRRGQRQRCLTKRRRRCAPRRRPAPLLDAVLRVAGCLLQTFRTAFTCPTYQRFVVLLLAAIVTTGCRTVLNLLRTVQALAPAHPRSYHRVFSRRRCSLWK
jgi:hypothetical protein